jgi:uncharacterized protein YdeI (YjbR/CyaY-like superfamily)
VPASDPLFFDDPAEWRSWLERNHATAREAWLLQSKKAARRPTITYEEALDEAACFGWIDSKSRRVDDEYSSTRWSPRRAGGNWTERNRERVARLISEGRMAEAGRATVPEDLRPR